MNKRPLILAVIMFASWTVMQPSMASAKHLNAGVNVEIEADKIELQKLKAERLLAIVAKSIGADNSETVPNTESGLSPSSRKKDHWAVYNEEDEINTKEREAKDYKSTIKKIKESDIKNNFEEKKTWIAKISEKDHMEIFISGGGFRGGIDPVINDRIMISNSGLLQKYYETETGGVKKYDKKIDRSEFLELIKWIAEKGFFSFEGEYGCDNASAECQSRLNQRPKPIPLKVVVAVGPYRNVVSVPIFAPDINQEEYIEYPVELKKIVEAIYVFASL